MKRQHASLRPTAWAGVATRGPLRGASRGPETSHFGPLSPWAATAAAARGSRSQQQEGRAWATATPVQNDRARATRGRGVSRRAELKPTLRREPCRKPSCEAPGVASWPGSKPGQPWYEPKMVEDASLAARSWQPLPTPQGRPRVVVAY
eukprot:scaffold1504_cov417-Prasinococcus_capsulatus_cf.AAC.51